ncbi:thylakoid membrane photosystem I accumulation factor [Moorena producens JHB]|uniref:Thylakoid membrane photosystem I accumulation factor n=1 Tax=Moorena producens (strain JHB) TaxID=1454205 RepID=A0A1D9FTF7_MOOP1|nr:thylakoid membrane photosystem I accumulation factor [Moorena producens JHB]
MILVGLLSCWYLLGTPSALASFDDDSFDGNIFALYAGNGSIVPPRITLEDSLRRKKPALLVFYVDDSKDCKLYSVTISKLQEPYGRAASFIPVNIDTLLPDATYKPTEVGYYYQDLIPQTVLIDQKAEVVLNEIGQVAYEQIDDVFREVFNLLPRSESVELKLRTVNDINAQLTSE